MVILPAKMGSVVVSKQLNSFTTPCVRTHTHTLTHSHSCVLLYMRWHIMSWRWSWRSSNVYRVWSGWSHAQSNMQDERIMPTQRYSIFICHTHILVSSVCVCACLQQLQLPRKYSKVLNSLFWCFPDFCSPAVNSRSLDGMRPFSWWSREKTPFSPSCYLSAGWKHQNI